MLHKLPDIMTIAICAVICGVVHDLLPFTPLHEYSSIFSDNLVFNITKKLHIDYIP